MSDFEIIQDQFVQLASIYRKIEKINIFNKYVQTAHTIGHCSDKVRFNTYKETYSKMCNENNFTIQMIDNALLCLYYTFDDDGKLNSHNLSFLPSYQNDIVINLDEFCDGEFSNEEDAEIEIEDYSRRLNNYIRIDYDSTGREEYYHALVHIHIGVFKETFRLPIKHIVTPIEFVYFILKYLYRENDDQLVDLENEIDHECLLTDNEFRRVWMNFM